MKLAFPAFLASAIAAVATASDMPNFSAVYSMTNAEPNEVIVWSRDVETGELNYEGSVATAGSGGSVVGVTPDDFPNPVDPFAAQDPIVVAGRCLLVVNAGSDTVSTLRILGSRNIKLSGVYPTNGVLPVSIAARDDLVYVLNAGLGGSFQGYRLNGDNCQMTEIGETIELDQDLPVPINPANPTIPSSAEGPAQIGFTPKGDILVTIKIRDGFVGATAAQRFGTLNHYKIGPDGTTSADALTVTTPPFALTIPFSFDFDAQGTLLLAELSIDGGTGVVGPGGVSFWEETDGSYAEIADRASVDQSGTCWLRYNPANRCLYTTNTVSGAISAVSTDGAYELVESAAAPILAPLNLNFSADYRYLYAYSSDVPLVGGGGQPQVVVYEVADDCGLTEVEREAEGYDPALLTASNGPDGVAVFPDFNQVSGGGEGMAPPKLAGSAGIY